MKTKEILSFRISPDLLKRLDRACAVEDRSQSYIVRRALEREMKRLERGR